MSISRLTSIGATLFFLASAGLLASPQAATPPAQAGSGLVWGRVVERGTDAPVPNAIVALLRGQTAGSLPMDRVRADDEGYFVFRDVPPGSWGLTSGRSGYMSSQLEPAAVTITTGQRSGPVTIRLQKYGAIQGRVIDEFGEPVAGVAVQALSRASHDRWRDAGPQARTDDQGAFTLANLTRGEYLVQVPLMTTSRLALAPADQKDGRAELMMSGSLVDLASGGLRPKLRSDGSCAVYTATYAVESQHSAGGQRVGLAMGERRTGLEVRLKPLQGVRLSGKLMAPQAGLPVNVRLFRAGDDTVQPEVEVARAAPATDGRFEFPCVPPGSYVVSASRSSSTPGPSIQAAEVRTGSDVVSVPGQRPAAEPTSWYLSARVPITVGEQHLDGLTVTLKHGVRIRGRIVTDQNAGGLPSFTSAHIVQFSAADGRTIPFLPARVDAENTFTTPELPTGRYLLHFVTPPGWQVRSAILSGQDVADTPFDLDTEPVGDVVITLTNVVTRVAGAVRDGQGRPAPLATILAFPTSARLWTTSPSTPARRIKLLKASANGSYQIAGTGYTGSAALPAGEYFLIAPLEEPLADWQDPESLAHLSLVATRITVREGVPTTQDLRQVSIAGWRSHAAPADDLPGTAPDEREGDAEDADASASTYIENWGQASAELSGLVLRGTAPVRGATVALTPSSGQPPLHTVTDDEGRFTVRDLEPGYYRIGASKPGLLAAEYGATGPGRPGVSVAISAGVVENVTLQMTRGAAVSGTVYDHAGRPLPRAAVRVHTAARTSAGLLFSTAPGAVAVEVLTDHDGRYRASGLLPGSYIVGATAGTSGASAAARTTSPADLELARDAVGVGISRGPAATAPIVMTVSVFYPGTRQLISAQPLTLGAEDERPGVDFKLPQEESFALTGTISTASGEAASGARVVLWPVLPYLPIDFLATNVPGEVNSFGGLVRVTLPSTGRFTVRGLTAGRYELFALLTGSTGTQWARQRIDIRSDNEVAVSLSAAVQIRGRLTPAAGSLIDLATLANGAVSLRSAESDSGGTAVSPPAAAIQKDGTFNILNVIPGDYWITVSRLPAHLGLVAARYNEQDALEFPVSIKQGQAGELALTVSDNLSELRGTFSDASGRPSTDYYVVAFSADRTAWFAQSKRVAAVRPNSDGVFSIRGLPAGPYRLAAMSDLRTDEWFEQAFLDQLFAASVAVTIRPGGKTVQDLRVAK